MVEVDDEILVAILDPPDVSRCEARGTVRPVRRRERALVPREELGRTLLAEALGERVAKVIDPCIGRVRTAGPSLHWFRFVPRWDVGRGIDRKWLGALP